MAATYCLAIEVESAHIEGGLGYMVAFRMPEGSNGSPENLPKFNEWVEEIKKAVTYAGDDPFNPDRYTKKVSIASLMHDITRINQEFGFQIGGIEGVPAVQIQSSNTHDFRIDIDFSDKEGRFRVSERAAEPRKDVELQITKGGTVHILQPATCEFPFNETVIAPRHTRKPPQQHVPRSFF